MNLRSLSKRAGNFQGAYKTKETTKRLLAYETATFILRCFHLVKDVRSNHVGSLEQIVSMLYSSASYEIFLHLFCNKTFSTC
jgi:hypothetical protein